MTTDSDRGWYGATKDLSAAATVDRFLNAREARELVARYERQGIEPHLQACGEAILEACRKGQRSCLLTLDPLSEADLLKLKMYLWSKDYVLRINGVSVEITWGKES